MSNKGEGKLMGFGFEEVVWMCAYLKKSGILRLTSPDGTGHIAFSEGRLIEVGCPDAPQLGELLVKHNFLTTDQLKDILKKQTASDEKRYLGEILVAEQMVQKNIITKLLEVQAFMALKNIIRWNHILYEFNPSSKKPQEQSIISLMGIEPFDILKKIHEADESI